MKKLLIVFCIVFLALRANAQTIGSTVFQHECDQFNLISERIKCVISPEKKFIIKYFDMQKEASTEITYKLNKLILRFREVGGKRIYKETPELLSKKQVEKAERMCQRRSQIINT